MALEDYFEGVVIGDGITYHFLIRAKNFVDALYVISCKCEDEFETFEFVRLKKWGD